MKRYKVAYKESRNSDVKRVIIVWGKSKFDALDQADGIIREILGRDAHDRWVYSVIYSNGDERVLNEEKPINIQYGY